MIIKYFPSIRNVYILPHFHWLLDSKKGVAIINLTKYNRVVQNDVSLMYKESKDIFEMAKAGLPAPEYLQLSPELSAKELASLLHKKAKAVNTKCQTSLK